MRSWSDDDRLIKQRSIWARKEQASPMGQTWMLNEDELFKLAHSQWGSRQVDDIPHIHITKAPQGGTCVADLQGSPRHSALMSQSSIHLG